VPHQFDPLVNDSQPAALRYYSPHSKAKWIWRCHVDRSEPDNLVWQFLRPCEEANKDKDIIVYSNLTGVGNIEVNAFQRASDLVI